MESTKLNGSHRTIVFGIAALVVGLGTGCFGDGDSDDSPDGDVGVADAD